MSGSGVVGGGSTRQLAEPIERVLDGIDRRSWDLLPAADARKALDALVAVVEEYRPLVEKAREVLRGDDSDRSDRDTLRKLWFLLLPDECGSDGTEERSAC